MRFSLEPTLSVPNQMKFNHFWREGFFAIWCRRFSCWIISPLLQPWGIIQLRVVLLLHPTVSLLFYFNPALISSTCFLVLRMFSKTRRASIAGSKSHEMKNKPINMKINDWRWFVRFACFRKRKVSHFESAFDKARTWWLLRVLF